MELKILELAIVDELAIRSQHSSEFQIALFPDSLVNLSPDLYSLVPVFNKLIFSGLFFQLLLFLFGLEDILFILIVDVVAALSFLDQYLDLLFAARVDRSVDVSVEV